MSNNLDALKSKLSGTPSIDGLIWQDHFTYAAESPFKNYINFSFDPSLFSDPAIKDGVTELPESAKQGVRNALNYVNSVTGILFNEVPDGVGADRDLVFVQRPLGQTTLSQDTYSYNFIPGSNPVLDVSDIIELNANKLGANSLAPGTFPYQGLLHEIGHALGLRDPDSTLPGTFALPKQYNNGGATIMSQSNTTTFNNYTSLDLGALNWLYGGTGLKNPGIVPSGDAASASITVLNQNLSANTPVLVNAS